MGRKGGRAWRTLRDMILQRDPLCTIRGPKCTRISTTVDHIIPISYGGAEYDVANLRGSCAPCNYGGGARMTNAKRRQTRRGSPPTPSTPLRWG